MSNTLQLVLQEAWGDIVTPDASFDGIGFDWAARRSGYHTSLRDRSDGRYLPVYETEIDLKAIRQQSWLMTEQVPMAKSIINGLVNYTISRGADWTLTHESPRLQSICNAVLKSFVNSSKWAELLERESFVRELSGGEFLSEIAIEGADMCLEPLEGDNLTEPQNSRQLEDWLGVEFAASWSFGICTRQNRWKPRYYHIVRNETGSDFDCLPPKRIVHWTRNVPVTAKRGFSDFYLHYNYLTKAHKVLENTAIGAALQAAIAYVMVHPEGQTKTGVEAQVNSLKHVTTPTDPISGQAVRTKRVLPGQRLDLPHGAEFHASLLGSNASDIYIKVMEALLRLVATVYHFPEHMITGFAGNNNMASSLVAESPFVQGRLADQAVRETRIKGMFHNVLQAFFESPWAARMGIAWEDVLPGLEITVKSAEITTRDPAALTAALTAQKAQGWVSDRTASQELGRDYEAEQENIVNERGTAPQIGPDGKPITPAFANLGRRQFKNNAAGIKQIKSEYDEGEYTRPHAEVLLQGLGVPAEDIGKILDGDSQPSSVAGNLAPPVSADGQVEGQAADSENLQQTALNGAQVTSMVDVIEKVSSGAMPLATAKSIFKAAFPVIPDEVIDAILGPISGTKAKRSVLEAHLLESLNHYLTDSAALAWINYP